MFWGWTFRLNHWFGNGNFRAVNSNMKKINKNVKYLYRMVKSEIKLEYERNERSNFAGLFYNLISIELELNLHFWFKNRPSKIYLQPCFYNKMISIFLKSTYLPTEYFILLIKNYFLRLRLTFTLKSPTLNPANSKARIQDDKTFPTVPSTCFRCKN